MNKTKSKHGIMVDADNLDYSQTYMRNKRLPRADVEFTWTPQMMAEIKKCKKDITYFAENYFHIVTLDEGKQKIKLYPAQKRILKALQKYRFNIINSSRQFGKALALDTPVPTPNGWTTMGDLKDGDRIFNSRGGVCNVVKAHEIMHNRPCYKMTFDNGEAIIADEEHLWFTQNGSERHRKCEGSVKNTKQIFNTLYSGSKKEPNHRISNVKKFTNIKWIYIKKIEKLEQSVPVRCITVDSDDSLYLVGETYIKTHNTTLTSIYALWMTCFDEYKRVVIVANKENTAIMILRRVSLAYEELPNWLKPGVEQYGKKEILLANGSSIAISTTTGSAVRGDSVNCVVGDTEITIRDKKSKKIEKISIEELYKRCENDGIEIMADLVDIPNIKNCSLYKNSKYKILTSSGFKDFVGVIKGSNDTKYIIEFESGEIVECTSKHKLMLDNINYVFADEIEIGLTLSENKRVSDIKIKKDKRDVYEILETENHQYIGNGISFHQCIIIDEAAHIENHLMEDFWSSVIPVISSSKKRTTKIFMTSTPKGTNNKFYEIFTKAKHNEADNEMAWHAEEVHWYDQPGRGKLWKQDMIEALNGDITLFEQEFNCAFIDSGDSAIDKDLLEEMRVQCRKPKIVLEDGHYKIWLPPKENHIYGIGVDVGEGIGNANSSAQVLDFTDLGNIKQAATFNDNLIHPAKFADTINKMGVHYGYPPILIERNNIGNETIAVLRDTHNYPNIVSYNPEKITYDTDKLGIVSHTNTKYSGVMNMRYWVNAYKVVTIYDLALVDELKTFVRHANGAWRKQRGNNIFDDRVMSLIWALFLLNDNVAERYYDIADTDENGKPSKLVAYTIAPPVGYKLDPFFQSTPGAPAPAFFNLNPVDDMNELRSLGWTIL